MRRIALPYRQPADPLTSFDAFADVVGAFAALSTRRAEVQRITAAPFSASQPELLTVPDSYRTDEQPKAARRRLVDLLIEHYDELDRLLVRKDTECE